MEITKKDGRSAKSEGLSFTDKATLASLALLIALIMASPIYLDKVFPEPNQPSDDGAIHPALASAPQGTNPGAPITIIEFGDYQCPYTAEQQPTTRRILTEYQDKINYLHMDLPSKSHPGSGTAAAASRCVLQTAPDKRQTFESLLYQNQEALSLEDLMRIARDISINDTALSDCTNDPSIQAEIQKDIDTAVKEGVTGTPTTFINGKPLRGVQSYAKLKMIIDSLLAIEASGD